MRSDGTRPFPMGRASAPRPHCQREKVRGREGQTRPTLAKLSKSQGVLLQFTDSSSFQACASADLSSFPRPESTPEGPREGIIGGFRPGCPLPSPNCRPKYALWVRSLEDSGVGVLSQAQIAVQDACRGGSYRRFSTWATAPTPKLPPECCLPVNLIGGFRPGPPLPKPKSPAKRFFLDFASFVSILPSRNEVQNAGRI